MPDLSTKPYLIRAIYEWCNDSGFTPYIAVAAGEGVRVPPEHVKNGEIVLNVSALATNRLTLGNQAIEFQARFGGVARDVYVPIERVIAIYARENGQGMAFEPARSVPITAPDSVPPAPAAPRAGSLELASSSAPGRPAEVGGPPTRPPRAPAPGERPRLKRVK
ncbi:MAG TPA: ClpXP protease specificity-enhancing factor [Burkholderiaceae bacterium]|jgi:stringent starvation protein B|nr:ClpXP protease specificity-enhancing factor [Burkholderiaceae bacterium]